jgi:nicotinate-nucleotide pyrophosphorylase (carboxylating)
MNDFAPPPGTVERVVRAALAEDLGVVGDITSTAVVPAGSRAVGRFVARDRGVLAGVACVIETFRHVDPEVGVAFTARDGDTVEPGQVLGEVHGATRSILAGERVALNLMCHLSGVATATRAFVDAAGAGTRILDTRKTVPGLRALQRAAVRAGGGHNHRDSLSDAVLLKDNHIAVVGITAAVQRARAQWPGRMVEVECETLDQVIEAVEAGADRVMLDNMTPEAVRDAVDKVAGRADLEVSGRISLDTVGEYAATGVDFISIGAITHSVRVLDIGLDLD